MKTEVLVVGAGASGLTAAIYAARGGCQVHVLEAQERPAKKILATGNGKCNFSNRKMESSCYRSTAGQQAAEVLRRYPTEAAVLYLGELGIWPIERDGYLYPASGQASSVADCLLLEAKRLKVVIHTEAPVVSIKPGKVFCVKTASGEQYESRYLVLAAGSPAGMRKKSWEAGPGLCRSLGLKLQPCVPALTALRTDQGKICSLWNGVRTQAAVSLRVDGRERARDTGEVQLTDYGISGIPVFQVSRFASYGLLQEKQVSAVLDFMPALTAEALQQELERRAGRSERTALQQLCGLWNAKLAQALCSRAEIAAGLSMKASDCTRLAKLAKNFELRVTAVNSLEQAQVCAGGVDLRGVDTKTMESHEIPGLYLTGELLDADGICGGYNLHWAWATGTLAGMAIGKKKGYRYDSDSFIKASLRSQQRRTGGKNLQDAED